MKRWSHVVNTVGAFAIFATAALTNAEIVSNPYKETIKKSDITIELQLYGAKYNSPLKLVNAKKLIKKQKG